MPSIRSRNSRSKPFMIDNMVMSEAMPSATPPIEIAEISETKRDRRRALVYRQPIKASTGVNMSDDYSQYRPAEALRKKAACPA